MFLQQLTMTEFAAALKDCRTVLIPFGSTEEHGDHLPLDTDTLQALELARIVAKERPLFVAPPVHYGVCRSSRNHPGTVGLTSATLKALVDDIVSDLYRQGLRNFILLSGHAGATHMATLVDAGEALLERYADSEIAVLCEYRLVRAGAAHMIETEGDSHAGEIETSRILNSHPGLVKGTSAREYPNFPEGILVRDKRKYWPGGVWGDPGRATAEKGRVMARLAADRLIDIIDRLEDRSER